MSEKPSTSVPLHRPKQPEIGDSDAQRRQDQNRLDSSEPDAETPEQNDRMEDAPPPDKQTPENYESEGGASPEGPVAIT